MRLGRRQFRRFGLLLRFGRRQFRRLGSLPSFGRRLGPLLRLGRRHVGQTRRLDRSRRQAIAGETREHPRPGRRQSAAGRRRIHDGIVDRGANDLPATVEQRCAHVAFLVVEPVVPYGVRLHVLHLAGHECHGAGIVPRRAVDLLRRLRWVTCETVGCRQSSRHGQQPEPRCLVVGDEAGLVLDPVGAGHHEVRHIRGDARDHVLGAGHEPEPHRFSG